jgi:hypothetical protein
LANNFNLFSESLFNSIYQNLWNFNSLRDVCKVSGDIFLTIQIMNTLLPIALGLLLLVSNGSVPVTAATSPSNCNKTLKLVKKSLSEVVTFKTRSLGDQGQPRSRSKALDITFKNDAAFPIESTQKSIATRVIKSCVQIASVSFGIDQTDAGTVYGLKNGQIIKFTCIEAGSTKKPNWGETYCA